ARQMKVPVVVEGVETQKQENYLLKMGCRYSQGYYYFKPMPIKDFENLICDERNVDYNGMWCKQVEQIHVREFLDVNLFNDTMINNILGPAAFYDVCDNNVEISRVNEQYYHLAGISTKEAAMDVKKIASHVYDEDRRTLFNLFEQAYAQPATGAEGHINYVRTDGKVLWVHMRVFFLREKDGHKMFYSALTDMTDLKDRNKEEAAMDCEVEDLTEKQRHLLERYYGNMPCGYAVAKVTVDEFGVAYDYDIVYANREMSKVSGGDMLRLRQLALKAFGDKKNIFMDKMYRAAYNGEVMEHHAYSTLSGKYLQITFYQYERGYVGCFLRDVTHTHIYQNALDSIVYSYREVYFVHLQDNYIRMIYPDENHMLDRGNYEEVVNRHFGTGRILPYDEENVRKFLSLDNLKMVLRKRDVIEYKYRRSSMGKGEEWCLTSVNVNERENGEPKTAIITIRSIESLMRENEESKRKQLAQTLVSMDEGFFAYSALESEEVLYANPQVLHIYGCKTVDEFKEYVGGTFKGMVHPDDLNRIRSEIAEQITSSDKKMDYIRYRIIRKDGEIRWIDDCGHLQDAGPGDSDKQFYVFISDITDTMPEAQKERLILLSQRYN
ncbi:MAG: PAS domain-containing protein, partial [Lachnospira sp.]|nr:PAS domain-containing protein [Lachnospira sp.]